MTAHHQQGHTYYQYQYQQQAQPHQQYYHHQQTNSSTSCQQQQSLPASVPSSSSSSLTVVDPTTINYQNVVVPVPSSSSSSSSSSLSPINANIASFTTTAPSTTNHIHIVPTPPPTSGTYYPFSNPQQQQQVVGIGTGSGTGIATTTTPPSSVTSQPPQVLVPQSTQAFFPPTTTDDSNNNNNNNAAVVVPTVATPTNILPVTTTSMYGTTTAVPELAPTANGILPTPTTFSFTATPTQTTANHGTYSNAGGSFSNFTSALVQSHPTTTTTTPFVVSNNTCFGAGAGAGGVASVPVVVPTTTTITPLTQQQLLQHQAALWLQHQQAQAQVQAQAQAQVQAQVQAHAQAQVQVQAQAHAQSGQQQQHLLLQQQQQQQNQLASQVVRQPGQAMILPQQVQPQTLVAALPLVSSQPDHPQQQQQQLQLLPQQSPQTKVCVTVQDLPPGSPAPVFQSININYPNIMQIYQDPPVYMVPNFLTADECLTLIHLAKDSFGPAPVVGKGVGEISASRTSSTCYLRREDVPGYMSKITRLTNKPLEHCELPQIGRYLSTQEYKQHYDAFDVTNEDGIRFASNGGQRVATVLVYLNTVTQGGCTHFPHLQNLKVNPIQGTALVFFPATIDGLLDKRALHAAEPAIDTKYVSQVWIRQHDYVGTPA